MKKTVKFSIIAFVSIVLLLSSCMKEFPVVKVLISTWDNEANSWSELKGEGDANLNNRKYIYGQNFNGEIQPNRFTKVLGPVDNNDETKGNLIRVYEFDGKTWSKDSLLGNQKPIEGDIVLDKSVEQLYAYYTVKDVPENEFEWSWKLVDPSQYIFLGDYVSDSTTITDEQDSPMKVTSYTGSTATEINLFVDSPENVSINAEMTTGTGRPIKGTGRTVTAPIPTRRGYKFVGWRDISQYYSRYDRSSIGLQYPAKEKFELNYDHGYIKGEENKRTTTLYAVWEPDIENGYWAKKDNPYMIDIFNQDLNDSSIDSSAKRYYVLEPYYEEVYYPAKGMQAPWNYTTNVTQTVTHERDFAMAEHELTGWFLKELHIWNNKRASAERFALPSLISAMIETNSSYAKVPTDSENYVTQGIEYYSGSYSTWSITPAGYSASLTHVHMYQVYVICNAMTAYYNDHNGDEEDLTYVYKNTDGTYVRTIAQAAAFHTSFPYKMYGHRGDLDATGFRLPTIYEHQFAMRVVPKSQILAKYNENNITWTNSGYKGSNYPQFQFYWVVPGSSSNNGCTYYGSGGVSSSNADSYAWYSNNSSHTESKSDWQARGFYSNASYNKRGTTPDKYSNFSGLHNMAGNISEWIDGMYSNATFNLIQHCYAGSSNTSTYCSYYNFYATTIRGKMFGFRTCRTVDLK